MEERITCGHPEKPHGAHGMCRSCYSRRWYAQAHGFAHWCLCGCGDPVSRPNSYKRFHKPPPVTVPCACGCGEATKNGQYKSGHRPVSGLVKCPGCLAYKDAGRFYRGSRRLHGICMDCSREKASASYPRRPRAVRGWYVGKEGYVIICVGPHKGRKQHRVVMEQMLGRPLRPEENVHHINGDRSDNRPENLELWSTSQPSGQRVSDKLRWAHEMIALYETTREDRKAA